ncbi:Rrf2 family transcriptional regulator [Corynebacterium sp. A21]|uniref:Rrf2 family transcriptional regulator n=1 Tax=Corynebacterium sp. A21 TaxID=3457318 RepID=UPI003FD06BB5
MDIYYPRYIGMVRVDSFPERMSSMQMRTGVEQAVYALLILSLLPERAVLSGEALSSRLGASPTYFQKLLRKLVQAGLLTSIPGAKGGFRLCNPPSEIQIYDVYMAIEGRQSLYSSNGLFDGLVTHDEEPGHCKLTRLMNEAESAWRHALQQETVDSLKKQIWADYPHTSTQLEAWAEQSLIT